MEITPQKTPSQRGFRSLLQNFGGAVVGLFIAVWNVPGVPDAIVAYAQKNFVPLFVTLVGIVGVPSAVIAYVQNKLEAKNR